MERRQFLVGCSAAAVAAGAGLAPSFVPDTSSHASLSLTRSTFERLLGSEFRLYDNGGKFLDKLRLVAIEDGPCRPMLDQFDLVWEGTYSEQMPDAVYRLTSEQQPRMQLALTPSAAGARRYRSTFSLLT
jgi:hypothetical protein